MALFKTAEIREMPVKQAKAEYSKMRRIANERIDRLTRHGKDRYIDNIPDLPPLADMSSGQVYQYLREVNDFLKNPFTLIRGIQRYENYMKDRFNAAGYDFVNKNNIAKVNFYMGRIKKEVGDKAFDSDEALEYIEQLERLGVDPEEFEKNIRKYMEYGPEDLETLKPIRTGRGMTFADVKKRIG